MPAGAPEVRLLPSELRGSFFLRVSPVILCWVGLVASTEMHMLEDGGAIGSK